MRHAACDATGAEGLVPDLWLALQQTDGDVVHVRAVTLHHARRAALPHTFRQSEARGAAAVHPRPCACMGPFMPHSAAPYDARGAVPPMYN